MFGKFGGHNKAKGGDQSVFRNARTRGGWKKPPSGGAQPAQMARMGAAPQAQQPPMGSTVMPQ